jgi:hypothetical protein
MPQFLITWFLVALLPTMVGAEDIFDTAAAGPAALGYQCAEGWDGPIIGIRGVFLPLPVGYGLVDRTMEPHEFTNLHEVLHGMPPGRIFVGSAPEFLKERQIDESLFARRSLDWKGTRREILTYRKTGAIIDVFIFENDVILQFIGAALKFAEPVASCYEELSRMDNPHNTFPRKRPLLKKYPPATDQLRKQH